jgi:hypothetical protein
VLPFRLLGNRSTFERLSKLARTGLQTVPRRGAIAEPAG